MNLITDLLAHYNYWVVVALIMLGMYVVMANPNLVKKVIGLNIFQTAVFIFYISLGEREGATAPILDDAFDFYVNPLPHVLILSTSIHSPTC
jgi:multicomponent Na+:H+ antiporter subunit C